GGVGLRRVHHDAHGRLARRGAAAQGRRPDQSAAHHHGLEGRLPLRALTRDDGRQVVARRAKSFPAAPPIAPVIAELAVPTTKMSAGTSPIAYDTTIPMSAHRPPEASPPTASDDVDSPFAPIAQSAPATSEMATPNVPNRAAMDLLECPAMTMASCSTVPTLV